MIGTKVAGVWVMIGGVLVGLLGLVHNLAAMDVFHSYGFDRLSSLAGRGFIYMFIGVGTAWVFAGLLLFASGRGLRGGAPWAWPVGFASAFLMVLFGVGAMVIMPENSASPFILGCSILAAMPFLLHWPSPRKGLSQG